jgi:hypothetical protein
MPNHSACDVILTVGPFGGHSFVFDICFPGLCKLSGVVQIQDMTDATTRLEAC